MVMFFVGEKIWHGFLKAYLLKLWFQYGFKSQILLEPLQSQNICNVEKWTSKWCPINSYDMVYNSVSGLLSAIVMTCIAKLSEPDF